MKRVPSLASFAGIHLGLSALSNALVNSAQNEPIKTGPGKRTWQTFHRQIGRSRCAPSSGGKRELERCRTR